MNLPDLRPAKPAASTAGASFTERRAALFSSPSPGIGDVLFAWSDVAVDGTPNLPPLSKKGTGHVAALSIVLGAFFGLVIGGGVGIGFLAAFNLSDGVWVFGPAALGAVLGAVATRAVLAHLDRFEPECVYVGSLGVERFQRLGAKTAEVRHTCVPYASVAHALHQETAWTRGGMTQQITELCQLIEPSGKELFTIASTRIGAPGAQTDLLRAMAAAYLRFRTPELLERARRGEPVRFPVFTWDIRSGFGESGQAFVFGRDAITLSGRAGGDVTVPFSKARTSLENGTLHLESEGRRAASVNFQEIGDGHALLALLKSREVAGAAPST